MKRSNSGILILVDSATSYGMEIIRGVDAWSQRHANWLLFVEPYGESEKLRIPPDWRGDGIIARVTHLALARDLQRCGLPVVNVSWSAIPGYPFHQVIPDEVEVGRLAAVHLLERGFRHFAYCGLPRQPNYTDRCAPSFQREIEQRGLVVESFRPSSTNPTWRSVTTPKLQGWLESLPKPVGVLAWGPERARQVTDACRLSGIKVPDEVAVLTTADDELMCGISHPPLSAVDERPFQVGFEAAAMLDRLMSRKPAPRTPTFVKPYRVVTRHSTDILAIDDREVADSLRFIRGHYQEPIDVSDVLKAANLSRRVIEQRFVRALGRTPAAELRRTRLSRACELLTTTDWKVSHIAASAGFSNVEGLNRLFRRQLGMSPQEFRSRLPSPG